jgi:hypothetical protein
MEPKLSEVRDTTKKRFPKATYRNGLMFLLSGMWLLHEATIFGVLLNNGDAWVYFPISLVLM